MDANTFTTSGGVTVSFRPVSQLLIEKVNRSIPEPQRPTYTTKIALPGQKPVEELVPMKSRDEARTDEERKAWDDYAIKCAEVEATLAQRRFDAILIPALIYKDEDGLGVKMPDSNDWIEMQEYFGVEVPQNKFARFSHYLQTEVIISGEDIGGLFLAIMNASGVPEEAIQAAEDSFRASLRQ